MGGEDLTLASTNLPTSGVSVARVTSVLPSTVTGAAATRR
jgi:hypothetical protein